MAIVVRRGVLAVMLRFEEGEIQSLNIHGERQIEDVIIYRRPECGSHLPAGIGTASPKSAGANTSGCQLEKMCLNPAGEGVDAHARLQSSFLEAQITEPITVAIYTPFIGWSSGEG